MHRMTGRRHDFRRGTGQCGGHSLNDLHIFGIPLSRQKQHRNVELGQRFPQRSLSAHTHPDEGVRQLDRIVAGSFPNHHFQSGGGLGDRIENGLTIPPAEKPWQPFSLEFLGSRSVQLQAILPFPPVFNSRCSRFDDQLRARPCISGGQVEGDTPAHGIADHQGGNDLLASHHLHYAVGRSCQ